MSPRSSARTPEEHTPPPSDLSVASSQLTEDDRQWLGYHVARAAEKTFPATERIGKTPQQDFYFRELLEVLIENTVRHGLPITGGSYTEIWRFTRDRVAKWRMRPEALRGRSGYRRDSIKTLVHEWSAAVDKRSRLASGNGLIEFVLDAPGPQSDDLVLRASIVDFRLQSGALFNHREPRLSEQTRLPGELLADAPDATDERQRLLLEARKYARRVEQQYLAKLSDAPLEFLQAEVDELKRARRDYRRLAAAVLVVVGTGMAAYKVLVTKHDVLPFVKFDQTCSGCVRNITTDAKGHVALLSSSGKRVTEWADVIVGPEGLSVRASEATPTSEVEFSAPPGAPMAHIDIPKEWHERPDVVLPRQVSCMKTQASGPGVMCFVLLDLRTFGSVTADAMRIGATYGDSNTIQLLGLTVLNPMNTRVATYAMHEYARDGTYVIWLVASPDRRLQSRSGDVSIQASEMKWLPLAIVTVQNDETRQIEIATSGLVE